LAFSSDPEKTLLAAFEILKRDDNFKTGDKVVVISDIISGLGVDAIQIRSIP
jgi:hypothetical protein